MPRTTKKTTAPIEKHTIPTVPAAEQPYQVPENWRWVRLGDVCIFENGYAFKSQYFSPENGVPVIRISDITDNEVNLNNTVKTTETNVDDRFVVYFGDLLIAMSGATTGKNGIYYSTEKAFLNQRVGNIKINQYKYIISKYRNYLILNKTDEILRNAYGGAQPNISSKKICMMPIPLPPLAEQQRIVDRIERLFAKLDEAREKAQAVVDGFENRKAAILHKAFTGELTRKWREERGIGMEGWKSVAFNEVASIMCNLVDPVDYQDFPHIAPDNIEKKTGMLLEYRSISEDKVISGKHRFYAGQILYSKIRPYLSKVVVVDFDGLCSADMYPIEANKGVDTYFLWYQMLSDDFIGQASSSGSRTVLPKINQKELSKIRMRVTCIDEQLEIVNSLNHLFAQERRARDLAESVIAQIDGMKKAILARAFRGELGTNVPGEAACEV